jgi:hypothetical protein
MMHTERLPQMPLNVSKAIVCNGRLIWGSPCNQIKRYIQETEQRGSCRRNESPMLVTRYGKRTQ